MKEVSAETVEPAVCTRPQLELRSSIVISNAAGRLIFDTAAATTADKVISSKSVDHITYVHGRTYITRGGRDPDVDIDTDARSGAARGRARTPRVPRGRRTLL